jgi:hypothetical protein
MIHLRAYLLSPLHRKPHGGCTVRLTAIGRVPSLGRTCMRSLTVDGDEQRFTDAELCRAAMTSVISV